MNKSEQLNELFAALSKAQAEMHIAGLTATNPFFKSKYADLKELVLASRPSLTKHGLAVSQVVHINELVTILGHSSGQYISSSIEIRPTKTDVQAYGSYITYLRRYAYAAIVGVVTGDEDDDGNLASSSNGQYSPKNEVNKVTTEQLDQLESELNGYPELAERMKKGMNIKKLEDFPKADFAGGIKRIQQIKRDEYGVIL